MSKEEEFGLSKGLIREYQLGKREEVAATLFKLWDKAPFGSRGVLVSASGYRIIWEKHREHNAENGTR